MCEVFDLGDDRNLQCSLAKTLKRWQITFPIVFRPVLGSMISFEPPKHLAGLTGTKFNSHVLK